MLRITKQTDYGIVLMTILASRVREADGALDDPDRRSNAPDLAAEASLPQPMASKILKILAREGLLESHRGVHGGYCLARAPEDISVAEIIEALEGPIAITECTDEEPGLCGQEATCPVRTNWNRINEAIHQALDQISLAEMNLSLTARPAPRLVELPRRGEAPGAAS